MKNTKLRGWHKQQARLDGGFRYCGLDLAAGDTQHSSADQSSTTENTDNRISSGEGSVNLTSNKSNLGGVSITQTDHSTVSKAFDFAGEMARGAATEGAASAASVKNIAQSAMQSVQDAYKGSTDAISEAYETSKAGEQKVMVAVGLVVVGIVAFKSFGSRA